MHSFMIHTLIDITKNGALNKTFPFETRAGDIIEDKVTLRIAKNQDSNFNTMIQMLQIRGNITWEDDPLRISHDLGNTKFGSYYTGTNTSWHFTFFTEQTDVFGNEDDPTEQLLDDFNLVPVLTEAKNTAHFPINTFITKDLQKPALNTATNEQKVLNALSGDIINTYFTYGGWQNK
tara:strand:+ start:471 stop:1001 length:531 start_codon:yes stop_codon:yes gene_type:complete